jgi:hypothetical protein
VPILKRWVEDRFGELVFRDGPGYPTEQDDSEGGHSQVAFRDGRRIRARLLIDESYMPF